MSGLGNDPEERLLRARAWLVLSRTAVNVDADETGMDADDISDAVNTAAIAAYAELDGLLAAEPDAPDTEAPPAKGRAK